MYMRIGSASHHAARVGSPIRAAASHQAAAVVGAGPAGLLTAIMLAQRGWTDMSMMEDSCARRSWPPHTALLQPWRVAEEMRAVRRVVPRAQVRGLVIGARCRRQWGTLQPLVRGGHEVDRGEQSVLFDLQGVQGAHHLVGKLVGRQQVGRIAARSKLGECLRKLDSPRIVEQKEAANQLREQRPFGVRGGVWIGYVSASAWKGPARTSARPADGWTGRPRSRLHASSSMVSFTR